jgi:two-component system, OmpR family, copper resistance phosphate regulon response regulator CusR
VRLLVVEDEPKVGQALREGLQAEGYEVVLAEAGEDEFFVASNRVFDLIVLDVMLPGRDGLEVLAALRRQCISTPVLLLTAKDAVEIPGRRLRCGSQMIIWSNPSHFQS